MKKIIALALALLLVCSTAALAEVNLGVTVSDLVLNVGETYALKPSFTLTVGADDTSVWAEVEAAIDGENVLAGQLEIADNRILVSVDGAEDVLVMNDPDALLADQGVTTAQFISMANTYGAFVGNGAALATVIEAFSGAVDGLTVEKIADMQYAISYENATYGAGASLTLTISSETVRDFVDLSAKTPVEVTQEDIENGTLPESDVKTVAEQQLETLEADESVAALISLIGNLAGSLAKAA